MRFEWMAIQEDMLTSDHFGPEKQRNCKFAIWQQSKLFGFTQFKEFAIARARVNTQLRVLPGCGYLGGNPVINNRISVGAQAPHVEAFGAFMRLGG